MTWRCGVCGHRTEADEQPVACTQCGQPGVELTPEAFPPEPEPPQPPSDLRLERIRRKVAEVPEFILFS